MPKYRICRHRLILQRETKDMNDKIEKSMKKRLYKCVLLILNALLNIKPEDIVKVHYERVDETDFRSHDYGFTSIILHTKFKIKDKKLYDKYKSFERYPDLMRKRSKKHE